MFLSLQGRETLLIDQNNILEQYVTAFRAVMSTTRFGSAYIQKHVCRKCNRMGIRMGILAYVESRGSLIWQLFDRFFDIKGDFVFESAGEHIMDLCDENLVLLRASQSAFSTEKFPPILPSDI